MILSRISSEFRTCSILSSCSSSPNPSIPILSWKFVSSNDLDTGVSEAGNKTTVDRNLGVMVSETRVEIKAPARVMMINGIFLFQR